MHVFTGTNTLLLSIYHILFNHLSVNELMGHFYFLASINAAANICGPFLCEHTFHSHGYIPRILTLVFTLSEIVHHWKVLSKVMIYIFKGLF